MAQHSLWPRSRPRPSAATPSARGGMVAPPVIDSSRLWRTCPTTGDSAAAVWLAGNGGVMDQATVGVVIDALKEAEIDLVVTLPEEPTHDLPSATQKDPYFTTVIVAGEGNGLALCGGAALAGRDCIFVTGVA